MKKYLFVLALVLALSIGTLTGGHLWMNGARDRYELTETVLAGDPAAVEGLSITYHSQDDDNHLAWSTTFTPGMTDQAETDFRFSGGKANDFDYFYYRFFGGERVELEAVSDSFGMSGSDLLSKTGSRIQLLRLPFDDVASRTAPDEERTETVRLADYYEYYPLRFGAASDWSVYGRYDQVDCLQEKYLTEYFRLKVLEDELVDVTVRKDSDGEVYSLGMSSETGTYLDSQGVVTEHAIFLIVESRDSDGNPDGRLECLDGPGIHRIPIRDPTGPRPEWFDLSKLRLFYPTGDARALSLTANPDRSELLLYTEEDGALRLTVLDVDTGEVLQRLDLLDSGTGNSVRFLEDGDAGLYYALSQESGQFSLVSRKGGRYECVLRGDFGAPYETQYGIFELREPTLTWNGERLAIVSAGEYCSYAWDWNGLTAGVWDAEGLLYLGKFETGLGRDPTSWGRIRYKSSEKPLTVGLTRK